MTTRRRSATRPATLIYGPGRYRFTDFLRVGTPLALLFWLPSALLIPRLRAF